MKTINDIDITGRQLILRLDLNVPMEDGMIADDFRIKEAIPTIEQAINKKAKVIILSHLGKVVTEEDLVLTLKPVAERLCELLGKPVTFIGKTRGETVVNQIKQMKPGDVIMLENTRFEDYPEKLESMNDRSLGIEWASYGDVYINDAFGSSHREHASIIGIPSHLTYKAGGLLLDKEIKALNKVLKSEVPLQLIMGGAKVNDKIKVINRLIDNTDYLLIGGGMVLPFIKNLGANVTSNLIDEENLGISKELLEKYPNKIILPVDFVTVKKLNDRESVIKSINEIEKDDIVIDIGPKSISRFMMYLRDAKMIVWNGPLGIVEYPEGAGGTIDLINELKELNTDIIIGGGDTVKKITDMGVTNEFTHVSTGGGATLKYLEGEVLPGINALG